MGLDSGLVLDDPVGEVYSDPFVPQEIKAFGSGIGLQQVPEMPSHPHCFSLKKKKKKSGSEENGGKKRVFGLHVQRWRQYLQ